MNTTMTISIRRASPKDAAAYALRDVRCVDACAMARLHPDSPRIDAAPESSA